MGFQITVLWPIPIETREATRAKTLALATLLCEV